MVVIISEPFVRDRDTIRARPKLASIALKERIIRIKNILTWVVGPRVVVIINTRRRARVSSASRAGRRWERCRRKVKRAARIINGWRVVKVRDRRGITIGGTQSAVYKTAASIFSFNGGQETGVLVLGSQSLGFKLNYLLSGEYDYIFNVKG